MLKSYSHIFKAFFILSDILIAAVSWIFVYYLWSQWQLFPVYEAKSLLFKEHIIFLVPIFIIFFITFYASGLYKPRRIDNLTNELSGIFKSSLIFIGVLSIVHSLMKGLIKEYPYSGLLLILFWGITLLALLVSRIFLRKWLHFLRSKGYNLRHILIVGTGSLAREVAKKIRLHQEYGLNIIGFLSKKTENVGNVIDGVKIIGTYKELKNIIRARGIDQVIFALSLKEYRILMVLLGYITDTVADIRIVPDIRYNFFTLRHGTEDFDGLPIITLRESPLQGWNRIIKKCFDFSVALLLLIIISPLLVLIAILIKLESPSPVLYKQERMGYDGKLFNMIKFRSMRQDAEAQTGAVWAKENDPRRTVIGKIIRKTSIDEIPQLINILKGEMSLVGPRPERPVFIEQFNKQISSYMLRHKMKAGVTGWAQINGFRGNTSLKKRIEYDLYYIENWSLWLDIKILLLTIPALFKGEGAY